ncbi:MAG: hypothetical protein JNM89_01300 [Hyphomicrobiaceae bacterium]|nr:hypothetical protein [Hyphomicrobiaceae bacterium]
MSKFAPERIEQNLVAQTEALLCRIEARASRLSDIQDASALMMLVGQVLDNVSALTGETKHDRERYRICSVEADYLFSGPLALSHKNRVAIQNHMHDFAASIRSTLNPPKDDDIPF